MRIWFDHFLVYKQDDVLDGHTINELSCTYADIWMKPMDYLKYVSLLYLYLNVIVECRCHFLGCSHIIKSIID